MSVLYNVTAYKGTGCNAINIPDNPDKFAEWATETLTLPAVDLLTDWGLDSVTLNCTEGEANGIDFIKIGGYYYAAGAGVPVAENVFMFPLTYDGASTNGGPSNLEYLDGVTERHTVDDDTMFKYTQPDEYMAPREALQMTYPTMLFSRQAGETEHTIVESTINLAQLGANFTTNDSGELVFNGTGITFTDPSTGDSVTCPSAQGVVSGTTYYLSQYKDDAVSSPNTIQYTQTRPTDGTNDTNIEATNAQIRRGLEVVRALSFESAVVSQVKYKDSFVDVEYGDASTPLASTVVSIQGKTENRKSGLKFKYYDTHNNRVNYGEYNKYGLMTASGDKGEFLPEQIKADEYDEDADVGPYIKMKADPRHDGRPYYRFEYFLGDNSETGFWMNALGGLQWENVPLTYQGSSGSYLNRLQFENQARQAKSTYEYGQKVAGVNTAQGLVNGVFDFMNAFSDAGENQTFGGWIAGMGKSISDTAFSTAKNLMAINQASNQYQIEREREAQNYGFSQYVVAPEVAFPFNANVVRDFVGNGVYVYRYYYTEADANRIDKLLTMYGYKDTVALTADLFNKRQNFDYVRASGVSIGGNIARWEKDAISAQLNAGVRVWHVKPSPTYYSQANPINTTT